MDWNFHRWFSIQKQVNWCTIDPFSLKFCTSQHSYPVPLKFNQLLLWFCSCNIYLFWRTHIIMIVSIQNLFNGCITLKMKFKTFYIFDFERKTNIFKILLFKDHTLQIRCVKLCKVVYYMNHTTGLCSSYSTQLYTTFYTAYTTDLQCTCLHVSNCLFVQRLRDLK